MAYSWLTFGAAKAELATRLNDTSFCAPTEAGLYIATAMREFNCLTAFWLSEYAITLTPPFTPLAPAYLLDQSGYAWLLSIAPGGGYLNATLITSSPPPAVPYIQLNDTVTGTTLRLSVVSAGVYPALTANLQTTAVAPASSPLQFFLADIYGSAYAVSIANGLIVDLPAAVFGGNWFKANQAGSPRQRTLTDVSLYTLMEYILLEPATGGTWTGTPQFSMAALSQAVQGRRDEALQIGATSLTEISLPIGPNASRVTLPDNALDVRRVRYVPATGAPIVLERGDAESFRVFSPGYLQSITNPLRWDVISGPPLALTLDSSVPVPATLECLIMQAGVAPTPPTATPLGIPDDYSWVPMFGALADLMSSQEESLDEPRAKYCMNRYQEGLEMLRKAPWLLEARINGVSASVSPVVASDRFSFGWQANFTAFPQVVEGGTDLFAVSPIPTAVTSVVLVVVANAPIPSSDSDFIQVPRDVMDALLDEGEHLAQLKRGGAEFAASMELHKSFLSTAYKWDTRVRASGPFSTTLRTYAPRNDVQQPRFAAGR